MYSIHLNLSVCMCMKNSSKGSYCFNQSSMEYEVKYKMNNNLKCKPLSVFSLMFHLISRMCCPLSNQGNSFALFVFLPGRGVKFLFWYNLFSWFLTNKNCIHVRYTAWCFTLWYMCTLWNDSHSQTNEHFHYLSWLPFFIGGENP